MEENTVRSKLLMLPSAVGVPQVNQLFSGIWTETNAQVSAQKSSSCDVAVTEHPPHLLFSARLKQMLFLFFTNAVLFWPYLDEQYFFFSSALPCWRWIYKSHCIGNEVWKIPPFSFRSALTMSKNIFILNKKGWYSQPCFQHLWAPSYLLPQRKTPIGDGD